MPDLFLEAREHAAEQLHLEGVAGGVVVGARFFPVYVVEIGDVFLDIGHQLLLSQDAAADDVGLVAQRDLAAFGG